jgi:HAD superfamily hydrolase (TIGR01509 family)
MGKISKKREAIVLKIKGILFDLDGTLTYPGALDFPSIKREMNCPGDTPILEYLETQPHPQRNRLLKILELREKLAAEASSPNIGADRSLLTLKQKGFLLGILTRNSLPSVRDVLKKFQAISIKDFSAVISREDSRPKPHPDGVYKAAQQMGISTSELIMVGDFRFDIIAGNAAGAYTVLLANGDDPIMISVDPKPDATVNTLEEILDILGIEN